MPALDMYGFIDSVFTSVPAIRISKNGGDYDDDGIWEDGIESRHNHAVNIQQASDREIDFLSQGGERITDARRIYINDGVDASISPSDIWEFLGQRWKCISMDNKHWRSYCKVIVSRIDAQ